ncbi:MAG: hypothetical protein WCC68_00965, partial [Methanoregula sp.]
LTAQGRTRIGAIPAEQTVYRPRSLCRRNPSAMGDLTELKEQIKITVSLLISAPAYSSLLIINQNIILCSYTVFRHKLCRYIYKKKENRVKHIYHIALFVR